MHTAESGNEPGHDDCQYLFQSLTKRYQVPDENIEGRYWH